MAEHPHIESHERLDTWSFIPVGKWLITMVSKSPKVGQRSPSKIQSQAAFHLEIFVNDTIGALDRTVSITMEDPSGWTLGDGKLGMLNQCFCWNVGKLLFIKVRFQWMIHTGDSGTLECQEFGSFGLKYSHWTRQVHLLGVETRFIVFHDLEVLSNQLLSRLGVFTV